MSTKRGKAIPGKGMLRTNGAGIPVAVLPGTRVADPRWMKAAVLRAMAEKDVFTIMLACKRSGVSTKSFYKWRKEDPDFAALVEEANENITQRLEQKANEFAVGVGVEAPIPSLMVFMLKARRPDVYRENTEAKLDVMGPNGANLSFTLSLGDRGGAPA